MKILRVAHGFLVEFNGGTETYAQAIGQMFVERGHICFVLAGSEQRATEATLVSVDQDQVLVTRYLRAEGRPRMWTEEYDADAEDQTRRLLARVHPDIVHLHQWQGLTNKLVGDLLRYGHPRGRDAARCLDPLSPHSPAPFGRRVLRRPAGRRPLPDLRGAGPVAERP